MDNSPSIVNDADMVGGKEPSTCRKCGGPIVWDRENGRWFGRNLDGSDHWDVCRDVRNARFIKGATYFAEQRREGWSKGGKELLMVERAYTHTTLKICPAPCGIPPWEVCGACPQ